MPSKTAKQRRFMGWRYGQTKKSGLRKDKVTGMSINQLRDFARRGTRV